MSALPTSGQIVREIARAFHAHERIERLSNRTLSNEGERLHQLLTSSTARHYLSGRREMRAACCVQSAALLVPYLFFVKRFEAKDPELVHAIGPTARVLLAFWDATIARSHLPPRAILRHGVVDFAHRVGLFRRHLELGPLDDVDAILPTWARAPEGDDVFLIELMRQAGHDRKAMTEELGFAPSVVGDWIRGTSQPGIEAMDTIAGYARRFVDPQTEWSVRVLLHFAARRLFRLLVRSVGTDEAQNLLRAFVALVNHFVACRPSTPMPRDALNQLILSGGMSIPRAMLVAGCGRSVGLDEWEIEVATVDEVLMAFGQRERDTLIERLWVQHPRKSRMLRRKPKRAYRQGQIRVRRS